MYLTKYDQGGTALIVFGEMHFLLIPENEFFHELNVMELQVSWITWTDIYLVLRDSMTTMTDTYSH